MIVCPVCEHQQAQGFECENCGKQLARPAVAAAAPVTPMLELEQTRVVASERLNVAVQPLADLEQNQQTAGPDLPAQLVAELETTALPKAAAVPTAPVPDLDTGRAVDDGQRTAAPSGAVTCRYCRNVQASGTICDKCGMRLPKAPAPRTQQAAAEDGWTICTDCGTRALIGRLCPSCGTRVSGAHP